MRLSQLFVVGAAGLALYLAGKGGSVGGSGGFASTPSPSPAQSSASPSVSEPVRQPTTALPPLPESTQSSVDTSSAATASAPSANSTVSQPVLLPGNSYPVVLTGQTTALGTPIPAPDTRAQAMGLSGITAVFTPGPYSTAAKTASAQGNKQTNIFPAGSAYNPANTGSYSIKK